MLRQNTCSISGLNAIEYREQIKNMIVQEKPVNTWEQRGF